MNILPWTFNSNRSKAFPKLYKQNTRANIAMVRKETQNIMDGQMDKFSYRANVQWFIKMRMKKKKDNMSFVD